MASTTSTALAATGDTRNVKTLYPHLKQQAKAEKGCRGLFGKKRKTYKDDDESDNPMGLIAHFGITANNNTGNLLYTQ
ncbi:hypothetical protein V2W45_1338301 [Cenococcum geophilum]